MCTDLARTILCIPRLRENPKTPLAKRRDPDSTERMIRPGFLDIESRQNLIELARDGLAAHRLARRANALVLLDDGMNCEAIAKVLLLDDDTIRTWYRLYEEDGIEGLTNFSYEGSACQLSGEQQEKLKAWVATALPRTTRQVGIHPVGAAGMALSELTAPSRQAARASGIGLRQFHGSSAARSVILWSAILASTSASQAWGSTSLSLAV